MSPPPLVKLRQLRKLRIARNGLSEPYASIEQTLIRRYSVSERELTDLDLCAYAELALDGNTARFCTLQHLLRERGRSFRSLKPFLDESDIRRLEEMVIESVGTHPAVFVRRHNSSTTNTR